MGGFKKQLVGGLSDRGWEQIEVDPEGVDWWAAEHWRLRSIRQAYGTELLVSFLVDPQVEGPSARKKSAVWAVIATPTLPRSRPLDEGVALLRLHRGRFDANLTEFLDELDAWRQRASVPLS